MILSRRLLPTRTELVPWTDRRGRFHPLRAVTLALLALPVLWLVYRWATHQLGGRPLNAAIHSTGYTAVWLLTASLAMTPAKALAWLPNLTVVRRMIGNAVLAYAALHLTLYMADQNWRLVTIVSEILLRFYLTIGFAALLGLLALGLTSTDGWVQAMGRRWKRLHRVVYAVAALGLVHYVLQSKLDVSQAMLAAGAFVWLMLWRTLPAGRDRAWLPLLLLSFAAAAATVALEYAWYRFGTRIDPMKILRSEIDVAWGLHPAGQVLALGLIVTVAAELRRLGLTAFGAGPLFTILVYAIGALVPDATAFFFGWTADDPAPGALPPYALDGVWLALFALLGLARWRLGQPSQRRWCDAFWIACLLYNTLLITPDNHLISWSCAALIIGGSLLLLQRAWSVSRWAALAVLPLALTLAYEAAALT